MFRSTLSRTLNFVSRMHDSPNVDELNTIENLLSSFIDEKNSGWVQWHANAAVQQTSS